MESENTFLRPGSKEAQEQGCLCPVLDNGGATEYFWVNGGCPIHGLAAQEKYEREEINQAFEKAGVKL
jgi:hypothetical protein